MKNERYIGQEIADHHITKLMIETGIDKFLA
ncbi:hypothetical protein DFA_09837 [Cavenderia fasciculata]|uniref:Uncharacterized protein n=1 Tax=Cavenderia fasciculata TaxID=261658 RepID=F4QAV6_CACFS|nr:uncharacterized protein DFA_09837 [Cavenderia fasciculata]EGG15015.1 hypothetical protein DFA_09837 [Cavenderia fasciculata]|eukprot:XP_004351735.1 hypothetical protein DFA_09837 [Cavenderia fasciculata]